MRYKKCIAEYLNVYQYKSLLRVMGYWFIQKTGVGQIF